MEEKKEKTIFDKIDEMYNLKDEKGNQKNKAFFSHLIKSYFPAKNVNVAFNEPIQEEGKRKVLVKCVFTNNKLITASSALKLMDSEDFKKNINEFLGSYDIDKACFKSTTPMKKLLKGRTLALQGKNTKTYMSQESYSVFVNWIMTKYVSGDKNIIWILNKITKNPFNQETKKRANRPKFYSSGNNKKTTLGELSALQELKSKFKK